MWLAAANCGRLAAAACADGRRDGCPRAGNAEFCRRDARCERESVLVSCAEFFTGEIVYSMSGCSPLGVTVDVTRMRFRDRFSANLRTANRSSRLDVA